MAKAKNRVIAGDYLNKLLMVTYGKPFLSVGFVKTMPLDKSTVAAYEVLNQESKKSATSGVARGILGGTLFGTVGMVAGAVSAKNKGIYHISINFTDGKRSLAEVDEKVYKAIMQYCF